MARLVSWRAVASLALGLPVLTAACSSPPSRLYLLSSQSASGQTHAASATETSGSSLPVAAVHSTGGPLVAVTVSIPEYLDRLVILQRTSANEVKPDYSAQWGENLGVTASRVVAENLETMVPSDDVVMLPSRSRENFDYLVTLNLTRFESDDQGRSVLVGRWSISDRDGTEITSGRAQRTESATGPGYDAMAAAMSHNLAAVSADIAQALQRLPTRQPSSPSRTPRRNSASGSTRR